MKDSFYFPHDYHARHDPKLERLRMSLGCEGVGIYWCVVEMLYEEGGSLPLSDVEIYAKALQTTPENIQKTLSDFKLFVKNKTHFYSPALLKRLKHINTKRSKASTSAKLSHSANALRTPCERSARKERKGKERKESKEEIVSPPDFIQKLKKTYSWIDVETELKKMDGWLLTHPERKKTERFVINWLNKIDKPVKTTINQVILQKPPEYKTTPEQQEAVSKLIHETAQQMRSDK